MIWTQRCHIEIGKERSLLGLVFVMAWLSGSHSSEVNHSEKKTKLGTHLSKFEAEFRPLIFCFAICRKQLIMFPSLFSSLAFQDYMHSRHFAGLNAVLQCHHMQTCQRQRKQSLKRANRFFSMITEETAFLDAA